MGRMLRQRIVDELAKKYEQTDNCVFLDFTGLDVESIDQLRKRIREGGMNIFIAKNSLLKLALDRSGLPTSEDLFVRPTAIITGGDDAVAICKLIVEWKKKVDATEIKGGLLERKLLTSAEVVELSKVPPRDVLLSQILGLFITPLSDIAGLLNNTLAQFANLLGNHIEKLEGKEQ